MNECGSNPCANGAMCIERSWKAHHGFETLLPEHYDPRHAAGYVCRHPPGLTGKVRTNLTSNIQSDAVSDRDTIQWLPVTLYSIYKYMMSRLCTWKVQRQKGKLHRIKHKFC